MLLVVIEIGSMGGADSSCRVRSSSGCEGRGGDG